MLASFVIDLRFRRLRQARGRVGAVAIASLSALAWALISPAAAAPAAPSSALDGRAIYGQHCAKCHGKKGEGVKGKYDEALHGDWSLEKLARVIDKTMPEDDPDKCDRAQSEAVA